ncbi:macro domain-containing protein [Cytobacillus sp. FJAT-54145]|uniref:Macro domain-containing protein n=1 Tax=Cytobacillus spartinae TaxID=3299023 RepID=A0ABW6KGF0_9BACI
MKNHYDENIIILVLKRVVEFFAKVSLTYAVYLMLIKLFSGSLWLQIFNLAGYTVAFIFAVYYSISIYKIINNYIKLRRSYSREFLDKKVIISYEVGSFWDVVDRFKDNEDVAIVLGVNNRFCLDEDYLSKTSLVYNYIQKLSDTEKYNLQENLKEQLSADIISYDQTNRPIYSNGALYVSHPTENIHYETALLAMCEPSYLNVPGKFTSSREGLIESFEKLFEQMPNIFTNSTLIIPLIGTKSSGSPLSQEEVAKFLISAFANYSRIKQHRLARRLVVSLYDKDFENMKDLVKLKKHIDMECEMGAFSYSKIKSEIEKPVDHIHKVEIPS